MRSVRLIRGRSKIIKEFKNSKEMEDLRKVFNENKDTKVLFLAEDSYVDTIINAAILKDGKLEMLGGNDGEEDTEA